MLFRPLSCATKIGRALSPPTLAPEALIIGAGGRLGQLLSPKLTENGLTVFTSQRSISQASELEIDEAFGGRNLKVIINCAVASKGSYSDMEEVNIHMPLKVATAAQKHGIPIIQTSTTATLISELGENSPYALTKKIAEEKLSKLANVTICRLCALTGDTSPTINISHMAGIGRILPIAIHLTGEERTIQPISYIDASEALSNLATALAVRDEGTVNPFPSVINFVGEPVSISNFVRMINETAKELHVSPEELLEIAEVVQNGSLTPEFIHLAMLSAGKQNVLCNAIFKSLLGNKPLASPIELALEIRNSIHPIQTMRIGIEIIRSVRDKPALLKATANFFIKRAFTTQ
jgi:nucleoside-diphosphate-sugar epimerase